MRKQFPFFANNQNQIANTNAAAFSMFGSANQSSLYFSSTRTNTDSVLNPMMFFDLEASLGFSTHFEIGHMIN